MPVLRPVALLALVAIVLAPVAAPPAGASPQAGASSSAAAVPSPEEFFGFSMGTARKLARWDRIVEYFELVAARSDRVEVARIGETTMGNPYLSVAISSPDNLRQAAASRQRAHQLGRGRVDEAEARQLAAAGPAIAMLHHNIHSTEIASSQTSVQLVWELATADDPVTAEILDGVITVLLPSGNPDGQIMVTDWYEQNVDTDFEDASMPWLYHHYAGHDNNRDFFFGSLVETRYWFSQVFDVWQPQVYLDQHQMGSTGPRMFVPPFPDPQSPDVPPLMYQEIRQLGGGIATDLQAAGKQGVITGAMYRIYGQEGALNGRFHGIVSLLTETASAKIATDVEVTQEELEQGARRMGQGYEFSVDFVDPWPAGTWRLQDIVDYQMIAARAFLKQAARYREDFQLNRWRMARESIADAASDGPYAWLVRLDQHDPLAAADMVERLRWQGIEIYRAGDDFLALPAPAVDPWAEPEEAPSSPPAADEQAAASNGDAAATDGEAANGAEGESGSAPEPGPEPMPFPAGTYVIPGAQTGRAALIDVLEVRSPDETRMYPNGPYMRRYDSAAYTMPMSMGVDVVRVDTEFDAELAPLSGPALPGDPGPLAVASSAYVLDAAINRSFEAVNSLLAAGLTVQRATAAITAGGRTFGPGAFVVPATGGAHASLAAIATEMRLPVATDPEDAADLVTLEAARIAVYQPWTASMDEGWTRYVLEDFDFAYETLHNDGVRAGALGERFDVIVLPAQISLETLIDGRDAEDTPEPYAGGIGEEGLEALRAFVQGGGTLLTFERSDAVALEKFGLPVKDALEGLSPSQFFYSPSLLHVTVDTTHPLGWGMRPRAAAFLGSGRAYEPSDWMAADGTVQVVASYPTDGRVLASGLLVGDEYFAGKGAVLQVSMGAGRVVMYGFRVQHRAQMHGTYKLLFNALYEMR